MSVIDGIIGGEGDGPLLPIPKSSGVLLAGFNPLAVDICATRLMGFDYRVFAQFARALKPNKYPIMPYQVRTIKCISNRSEWSDILEKDGKMLGFKPAVGWEGEIEFRETREGNNSEHRQEA